MRGRRVGLGARALLFALWLWSPGSTARAYVRNATGSGAPLAWQQTCVRLTVYPSDLTDLSPAQTLHAVSAAAAAWSAGQNACTFLGITAESSADPTPAAGYDMRNVVVFRRDSFCGPSDPVGTCSYDPAALAITSVFASATTGRIRDADIEVNARYVAWTDVDTDPAPAGKQDLQNALTHEMGHLIGLGDSCYAPGSSLPRPVDNLGQPAPDCATASAAVRATTMFPNAAAGDVSRRTLAADDIQGLCDSHPLAQDPMLCPAVSDADGGSDGAGDGAGAGAGGGGDSGTTTAADASLLDARQSGAGGGGTASDAGSNPPSASGCGCELGGREPAGAWALAAAALALLLRSRRRGARTPSSDPCRRRTTR